MSGIMSSMRLPKCLGEGECPSRGLVSRTLSSPVPEHSPWTKTRPTPGREWLVKILKLIRLADMSRFDGNTADSMPDLTTSGPGGVDGIAECTAVGSVADVDRSP